MRDVQLQKQLGTLKPLQHLLEGGGKSVLWWPVTGPSGSDSLHTANISFARVILRDTRFSQRNYWGANPSGMLGCGIWWVVRDVSKCCIAFKLKRQAADCFVVEDEVTTILRNVENHSPNEMASRSTRTECSSMCTAVLLIIEIRHTYTCVCVCVYTHTHTHTHTHTQNA